jgi:hypothetical protein
MKERYPTQPLTWHQKEGLPLDWYSDAAGYEICLVDQYEHIYWVALLGDGDGPIFEANTTSLAAAKAKAQEHYANYRIVRVPLSQIEPLWHRWGRPDAVRSYVAMLREGKTAPPIQIIKQRNKRHRYRIYDGTHRVCAARRVGQKTIEAQIIAEGEQFGVLNAANQ